MYTNEYGIKFCGDKMLNDFILPKRVNQVWEYSGMDSPTDCLDKQHFKDYPHTVTYNYNSRGFRDVEWPDNLRDAIWCIGDSFTAGVGAPIEHTWAYILEQRSGRKCINISMDGASNNWIGRRALAILEEVNPKNIVIHWSHLHRRESTIEDAIERRWAHAYKELKKFTWPKQPAWKDVDTLPAPVRQAMDEHINIGTFADINDEHRREWHDGYSDQDIPNTINYIKAIGSRAVHTFVPGFAFTDNTDNFYSELEQVVDAYVPELVRLDRARDGHHYDILTATSLVDKIIPLL